MDRNVRIAIAAAVAVSIGLTAAAALFVLSRSSPEGEGAEGLAALEKRLDGIEARLEGLDRLEAEVRRLAGAAGGSPAASEERSPGEDGPALAGADAGEAPEEAGGEPEPEAVRAVAAAIRSTGGEEGLRRYIARVVDEQRTEREAAAVRRIEERRQELLALQEGPYGKHNYRVNSMAKRLGFSDAQKAVYYSNLVEYSGRIDALREQEKADAANAQRYRDARAEARKEFAGVIVSTLTPQQAETFKALPEFEQRPDGGIGDVSISFSPAEGLLDGIGAIGAVGGGIKVMKTFGEGGTMQVESFELPAPPSGETPHIITIPGPVPAPTPAEEAK